MRPITLLFTLLVTWDVGTSQSLPEADLISEDVARGLAAEFGKLFSSKDERERLAAVDTLSRFRHPLLAKALIKALNDASPLVAEGAAVRLGVQDKKDAGPALRSAWKAFKAKERNGLQVAVLGALRRLDALPSFKELTDPFDRSSPEVQREIVRAAAQVRDLNTVEWLANLLEEPAPENRDDPTNPPADYWKERVASWKYWVRDVHHALHELTGQDFEDKKHVREWRKKGGKIVKLPAPEGEKKNG